MKNPPLAAASLYQACNTDELKFTHTDELNDIDIIIGQERAIASIRFGLRVDRDGYNIFALAPAGTGKMTTVRQLVEHEASAKVIPCDWCYVNNFEQPARPKALKIPGGKGKAFREDMEQLIDELRIALPASFEGDEYRSRVEEIEEQSRRRELQEINQLREDAARAHIILTETPTGYAFAPVDEKEVVIDAEHFNQLPAQQQQKIQDAIVDLQQKLQKLLKKFPAWRKETKRKIKTLNREVAEFAVGHSIHELKESYHDQAAILDYLADIEHDIIEHVRDFIPHRESLLQVMEAPQQSDPFKRYQVNLIVDLAADKAAPVIYEDHPNYANLMGRVDHQAYMGSLVTDFTMIKPGALHQANGGYLLLDARKLLMQPYAWESLKRTLQAGEIKIESLEHSLSLISTSALEPEPIPLELKLILIGDRLLYYLLNYYDPEFQDLFKVAADFDDSVDRAGIALEYAKVLATIARQEKLKPLTRLAVGRVIEHSARMAGDAEKLSTHLRSIKDLLIEADYWAKDNGHEQIGVSDVQQAIDHKIHRSDRIRQKFYENIHRGTVLIDTEGKVAGQINALSVLQLGEFTFGQPTKITATTRLGNGKLLDIERETELGGALHSKGVLIMTSFIASRYARNQPFSMSASLVFEQSYGGVDGDSASLAELCVILSALTQIPLRQDLAITGSVNQLGQVQPIGGVNEKIEGFFDICNKKGLTGQQGVIIPATNIKHLMLRWDVVNAARSGQFCIYAVATVDQALELLTGLEAGNADEQGVFEPDTINGRVAAQLAQFTTLSQHYSAKNNTDD
ncbi:MAG: ATP-dependent protease [Gammaproteobacteria bacterium HGW-Gammaproteobacteria-3]|nr:MAG: ATP-dependent protease [Gammaproteobacteria bacterium HGW-Gammaproteobacteria-3]